MSVKLLIDGIIHQTMVLVAHVSTAAGLRAPLAHVANQVFIDLVSELERQGVGRKVVADMFGLALRSYQLKVQRLSESAGERGRSLWEVVLRFIQEKQEVGRGDVLTRFAMDGSDTIASILRDLSLSGLVVKTGHGAAARYRAVSDEERALALGRDRTGALPALVWVTVYAMREISEADLAAHLKVDEEVLGRAVDELLADGRLQRITVEGPEGAPQEVLTSVQCVIPLGEPVGWEAAVVSHFQAMVGAIVAKIRAGKTRSEHADLVGGSTWSMYVWPGHPHHDEVLELLARLRELVGPVRQKVTAHNEGLERAGDGGKTVLVYVGQNVILDEESGDGGEA